MAIDPRRAGLYRALFSAAALYNFAFGAWTVLWPEGFFGFARLDPPRYHSIWGALGMAVGVYGLVYLYCARHLERAKPFIAVGLLGKTLGPLGWAIAVMSGDLPARTFTLIALNDLFWWLPFSLFLLEGVPLAARVRSAAPFACAAIHVAAALAAAMVLRGGTAAEPDAAVRSAYVAENLAAWRAGWSLWMLAGVSLLTLYAWWAVRLSHHRLALAAVTLAFLGLLSDYLGLSLLIGWGSEIYAPVAGTSVARLASMASFVIGNALYVAGGILLTAQSSLLPAYLKTWSWAMWAAGTAVSVTALIGWVPGLTLSSFVLFTLLPPWCLAMWRELR